MSPARGPSNVAGSVRARLLNLSRARQLEFQLLLSEFAIERLLYRLGISNYSDRFVLKGAMLFKLWPGGLHRASWDLDLLGRGVNGIADVTAAIKEVAGIDAEDGLVFDAASAIGEEIRVADEYAGVRIKLEAYLAEARIPMQVDVGFGDTITPVPVRELYPTLLDHPPPNVLVYSRESVVAEKLEAMISLGVANSRMKDFYDVFVLASNFVFEGPTLSQAIRETFICRAMPFPESEPLVLTHKFLTAPERQIIWRAFLRRGRLQAPQDAGEMADVLRCFLIPVLAAAATGESPPASWPAGGPWR